MATYEITVRSADGSVNFVDFVEAANGWDALKLVMGAALGYSHDDSLKADFDALGEEYDRYCAEVGIEGRRGDLRAVEAEGPEA